MGIIEELGGEKDEQEVSMVVRIRSQRESLYDIETKGRRDPKDYHSYDIGTSSNQCQE